MRFDIEDRPFTSADEASPVRLGPKAMRALAHPIRLELLEQLALAGSLTAAQASQRVGESPANCSFHLRTLAKYGFVEPTGDGRGRERPWRRVVRGLSTPEVADEEDDPAVTATGHILTNTVVDRHLRTIEYYRQTSARQVPAEWRRLAGHTNVVSYLTLAELAAFRADLIELFSRHADRSENPSSRPAGSRPVQIFAFTMPRAEPPPRAEPSPPTADQAPEPA